MSASNPPLPELIDADEFRRQLAGLTVPRAIESDSTVLREIAVEIGVCAAKHYNRDTLDPIRLWDRVATAFASAVAKAPNGDAERLVSAVLEHVRADPGGVTRDDSIPALIARIESLTPDQRQALIAYITTASYAVVIHARAGWERHKARRKPVPEPADDMDFYAAVEGFDGDDPASIQGGQS